MRHVQHSPAGPGSCKREVLLHALPQMHGMRTIVIEDVDGRSCRHSIQGEIRIGIFGVGKIAEHSIVEGTVKTFAALPAVVERWLCRCLHPIRSACRSDFWLNHIAVQNGTMLWTGHLLHGANVMCSCAPGSDMCQAHMLQWPF